MADEEDLSSLPLTDRAVHKQWKVRQAAYDEMQKQFTSSGSESDGCFRPFIDNPALMKKVVTDANVVAQENGMAAVCAFLEFGGSNACLRTRGTVVASLIEKGLGSSRAGTKRNAVDALLWYIELDTPDPVIEELLPFLTHKIPKLVVGSTNAITEIIRAFGAKTVSVKPIVPVLPKLFAHADKNVRAETSALVVELYKWLGDGFAQLVLPDLKPVQQRELEAEFAKVKGETPHQQRYLKGQRDAMERQQLNGINDNNEGGDGAGAVQDEDEEMPDLVDPVAVMSKVPVDFETRVTSTKWKDRKEVLEEVRDAFNVPKMENEEFGDMVRVLGKCMKDANVMVVIVAANIVEQIANGLKSGFAKYQPVILAPILERTKEKKVNVTEALGAALDAVFKSTGMVIGDVLDPILEYLKHKTPQVKIETAKYLIRCLKTTRSAPKDPEMKSIAESGIKLLSETQEPVRAGGQEILGVLMKIFGERPLNPHLESVDEIKKKKVKEFCDSVEVKAKADKPKPPPAAKSAQSTTATGRKIAAPKKQQAPPSQARTPKATTNTPALGAPSSSSAAGKKRLAASPLKPTGPRDRNERFADEPQSPVSAAPPPMSTPARSGNNRGGLTGRSLTSASQARAAAAPPPPDPRLQMLEKQVEELNMEKEEWKKEREQLQWKSQEEQAEKARLMQEINDLQLKNAQLVEDHTRDILAIKSKETQLVRAQSDADTARHRIAKLEQEVERYSKDDSSVGSMEGAVQSRTGSGSPRSPPFEQSQQQQNNRMSRFGGGNPQSIRRSVDFSNMNLNIKSPRQSSIEDKENSFKQARGLYENTSRSSSSSTNNESQHQQQQQQQQLEPPMEVDDGDGDVQMPDSPAQPPPKQFQSQIPAPTQVPGENWKRAAEVTSQLRARIEAMKARQNRTR